MIRRGQVDQVLIDMKNKINQNGTEFISNTLLARIAPKADRSLKGGCRNQKRNPFRPPVR